jgi:pSer/pThr/pTyr-binding forkhead associated (FHA) protein
VICTRCGQQNPDDSRFCSQCGAALTRSSESAVDSTSIISGLAFDEAETVESTDGVETGQLASMEALPAGSGLLVVKRGPNAGSRFLLDQDVTTAGRHPDSDIFLDDVTVSRRHAEFRRSGLDFTVSDVGSLNGTYLNRERIESATLAGGDEVQIGKFRLVFLTGARVGGSASAEEGPRSEP